MDNPQLKNLRERINEVEETPHESALTNTHGCQQPRGGQVDGGGQGNGEPKVDAYRCIVLPKNEDSTRRVLLDQQGRGGRVQPGKKV